MQVLTALDRDVVARLRERDEFFWMDLHGPSDEELDQLADAFGFHELALEDSREFGQRPKVNDYGHYALLVYYGMDGEDLVEVHCYINGEAIITVRRDRCRTLTDAHERLARVDPRSEEEGIYRVLDSLTDSYFPALEAIQDEIDDLQEVAIVSTDPSHREQIFRLRRRLSVVRRVVGPERDMFAVVGPTIDRLPGLSGDEAHDYFRDIYDHLLRINDSIDSARELLSGALDLHLAAISQHVNDVTKQLTLIATIFLPLTFVTGFFGQNFGWMVNGISSAGDFFAYGIGGLAVAGAALTVYFRRSGFFGP